MAIDTRKLEYLMLKYDSNSAECLDRYKTFVSMHPEEERHSELGRDEFLIHMSKLLNGNNGQSYENKSPQEIRNKLINKFPIFEHIILSEGEPKLNHENNALTLEESLRVNPEHISNCEINEFCKKLKQKAELSAGVGEYDKVNSIAELYQQVLVDFDKLHTTKDTIKPGFIGRLFGKKEKTIITKDLSPEDKRYFDNLRQKAKENLDSNKKARQIYALKQGYFSNGGNMKDFASAIISMDSNINPSELEAELKIGRVKELLDELNPFVSFPREYELEDLAKVERISEQAMCWIMQNGGHPLIISLSKHVPAAVMNVHLGIYRNETFRPEVRQEHLEKAQDIAYNAAMFFAEKKNPLSAIEFSVLFKAISETYMNELKEDKKSIQSAIDKVNRILKS
ncbi:hypothetical protein JW851_01920 [Candidatus Woesearchaeota archaeon]|nr:hypothetical protein [Candidatus Woesearchaeota archaeon]